MDTAPDTDHLSGVSDAERVSMVTEIATRLGEGGDVDDPQRLSSSLRTLGVLLRTGSQKSKGLRRVTDALVIPALLLREDAGRGGKDSKKRKKDATGYHYLESGNADVRLYAGMCCLYVLRLHAPDSPFGDDVLGLLFGGWFRGSVVGRLMDGAGGAGGAGHGRGGGTAGNGMGCTAALEACETVANMKMCLLMLDLDGADGMLVELCGAVFGLMDELAMVDETVNGAKYDEVGDHGDASNLQLGKNRGARDDGYVVRVWDALLGIVSSLVGEADYISQGLLDMVLGHLAPSSMFGSHDSRDGGMASLFAKALLRESREALQPSVQRFIRQVMDGETPAGSDLVGNASQLILRVHEASPQMMLPVMPSIVSSLEDGRLGDARRAEILDLLCSMFCESGNAGQMPAGGSNMALRGLSSGVSEDDGANIIATEYPELLDGILQRLKDQSAQVRKVAFKHVHGIVDSLTGVAEKKRVVRYVGELLCHVDERSRAMAVVQFSSMMAASPELVENDMFGRLGQRLWDSKIAVRKAAAVGIAKVIRTWCARYANGLSDGLGEGLGDGRVSAGVSGFAYKTHLVSFIESLCSRAQDPTDGELQMYIEVEVLLNERNGLYPSKKVSASILRAWWSMIWAQAGDKTKKVLVDMIRRTCQVKERISIMLQLRLESKVERTTRVSIRGLQEVHEAGGAIGHEDRNQTTTSSASDRIASMIKSTAAHYLSHVPRAEESLQRLFGMKDNNVFRNLDTVASFGAGYLGCVAASKELQARIGNRGPTSDCAAVLSALMCPTLVTPEVLAAALKSASGSSRDYGLVMELAKAEPRMFVGTRDTLEVMIQSDDSLEAALATEVLATAGKYVFATEKCKMLGDECLERLVRMCSCGNPKTAKIATMALLWAVKFHEEREDILQRVCDGAWTALKDAEVVDDHPLLLSHVKVLSVILRMDTSRLDLYAAKLHKLVMGTLLPQDLSLGRALTERDDDERGFEWGRPSADVEIKAELIKAVSQAMVPIECVGSPSEGVIAVAKQLCAELQDLTDIDTSGPQFESLVWKLKRVEWVDGKEKGNGKGIKKSGKSKATAVVVASSGTDDAPDPFAIEVDINSYADEEQRVQYEKGVADASPDAGWTRLAAAKSLFRLFRVYDRNFSGNDYLGLGLACQDPIAEVRRAILKKVDSNMAYLLRYQRSAQKRMAKTLALYSLYAADPTELNVKHAFHSMQRVIAKRRVAVAQMSLAKASSKDAGTLSNEMPEFALVYLVYFIAHHPDYSSADMEAEENAISSDSLVVLFKDTMQMFLEALLLPSKRPKNAETMANTLKVNAGVAIKILRQLKYCDIFDLENEVADAAATINGHQICDIGMSLSRRLLVALSPLKGAVPSKFSGSLHLPSSYYHQKSLTAEDKRLDGSDLPPDLRGPRLRDPLFSEQCGIKMKYRTATIKRKAVMEPSVKLGDQKKKSVKPEHAHRRV